MRISGGTMRGVPLKSPKTMDTRPMSDRLKLALFAILEGYNQPHGKVLDLFSGSGALGLEALSRGADTADLVDRSTLACAAIRENIAKTRTGEQAKVHKQTVSAFIERHRDAIYDLILLDPPYADPAIASVLEQIDSAQLLSDGGILVLGHTSRREFPDNIGTLRLLKKRCHGDSCVSLYSRDAVQ